MKKIFNMMKVDSKRDPSRPNEFSWNLSAPERGWVTIHYRDCGKNGSIFNLFADPKGAILTYADVDNLIVILERLKANYRMIEGKEKSYET